jgi:uncharacterized protein
MNYPEKIALEIHLKPEQVSATIDLLDSGNTVPFIARYRKEITGGMDEEQIRQTAEWVERLRALEDRRQTIMDSIEEQGKLSADLGQRLLAAETRTELEDLYQPYKPKRKTRASIARDRGLQGLADLIFQQIQTRQSLIDLASKYLSEEVPTTEDALAGARDIVAETISDMPEIRQGTREKAMRWGSLRCEKTEASEDARNLYQLYYKFVSRVDRLHPHQILAINRGESEKILRVKIEVPGRDWRSVIQAHFRPDRKSPFEGQLSLTIEDAAERLLLPAIERDVRRKLTEQAEDHAIKVFATNLRALLNLPPISGHVVTGLDPGFRTGCKVAVVDETGKVLDSTSIFPHEPQKQWAIALNKLKSLIARFGVSLIAIGNGTASRETEQLVAELTREDEKVRYLIVSEAGASVYSASPLARSELPDLDVSIRGAVSIARRVQDPLAELVKIDPKSIGVGMYQHDVDQKKLNETLNGVVESVVNRVGVDVNTASPALLTYVSGIGPSLAERVVDYRDQTGPYKNRGQLMDVPGLGPKSFEQAAGFLRIRDGENRLDATAIHPESYAIAEAVLQRAGTSLNVPVRERQEALGELMEAETLAALATQLEVGLPTLKDIFEQMVRPGRDPRQDLPAPILRSDVLSMDDLTVGMRLLGTVRNVVDFGAFVDIGVKNDGLLHRSQIPRGEILVLGDVIEVEIQKVEPDRGRISLGWIENPTG